MRIPRKSDYHIYALRRSGHHAIMNWLIWSMPSIAMLCNDRIVKDGKVFKRGKVQLFKGSIVYTIPKPVNRLAWNVFPARTRVESFEDEDLTQFLKAKNSIIVIRDFYNNMASRLKWERDFRNRFRTSEMQESETRSQMLQARDLWKKYAEIAMNPPSQVQVILYDSWMNEEAYRSDLREKLGIKGNDQALNITAQYGPGSSFEGMSNTPDRAKLSNRFKVFATDELYMEIASDPEVLALNKQIFGETASNGWADQNFSK